MDELDSNNSRVTGNYGMLASDHLVKAIRAQARLILTPYFRRVSLTYWEGDKKLSYPILTDLASRIINEVYEVGSLGYELEDEAKEEAFEFVRNLHDWQKECLAFYFGTNEEFFLNEIEPHRIIYDSDIPEKIWSKEKLELQDGKFIRQYMDMLIKSEGELAVCVVKELVYLEEIFSIDAVNQWDVTSIIQANMNFEIYAGKDIKLIPLPIDEMYFWNDIFKTPSEVVEVKDNREWIAQAYIDYIKEFNRALYLELEHNGKLEQSAKERQDKFIRNLRELKASGKYTLDTGIELFRKIVHPKFKL